MRFQSSKKLNKRFHEVMSKLTQRQSDRLCEETPNPLYQNVVIPTDSQFVWFEEGAKWAQQYPTSISVYRIPYDTFMHYMIGTEDDCLDRLNIFATSQKIEVNDG